MNVYKIIFENGVEVRLEADGIWYFQSASCPLSIRAGHLKEITRAYKVRPIVISYKYPNGHEISLLLPYSNNRKFLDIEHSEMTQGEWITNQPRLFTDGFNISYIVGAVVYHCKQLAEIYCNISRDFSKFPAGQKSSKDKAVFSGHPEAYYEFDALITAARRAYDTTRYLLWKVFGPQKGSLPSSFPKALPKCTNIPPDLSTRLAESWSNFGEKITEYRDCIQHYVPLDFGLSSAFMTLIENKIWSVSLLIPDNPEEKSKRKLKYANRIDALNYGWKVTSEIMDIATRIIKAIPAIPANKKMR